MKTYIVSGLLTVRVRTRVQAEGKTAARLAAKARKVEAGGDYELVWVPSLDEHNRPSGIHVELEEEASE